MTATDNMMRLLLTGEHVGTDNTTCVRIGTNQVPDVARKLRARGVPLFDETVQAMRFGKIVNCKRYYLSREYIESRAK